MVVQMAKTEQAPQSFAFKKIAATGNVLVLNSLSYVMAEYDGSTGLTSWKRMVSAPQREDVQQWLLKNYPIPAPVAPVTVTTGRKQKRAA